MTLKLPSFRIRSHIGRVVTRDGLVLCFFMRRSHGEVAAGLWRALQAYRGAIPPQSLAWYGTDDGDWAPLDGKGWEHIRREVLENTWPAACHVELEEDCGEVRAYSFVYTGKWLDAPLCLRDEGAVCAASFTLPTEYLLEHGPTRVQALALALAGELPFSFGYASLAFLSPCGYASPGRDFLHDVCFRFPGLDAYHLARTSWSIGARARGAYWLTFLGEPLLGQLGGPLALRQSLPSSALLEPLDSERLLVRLGEWPLSGDTEAGEDMSAYRALASLLEPHLYQESIPWLINPAFERRWLRRFLE